MCYEHAANRQFSRIAVHCREYNLVGIATIIYEGQRGGPVHLSQSAPGSALVQTGEAMVNGLFASAAPGVVSDTPGGKERVQRCRRPGYLGGKRKLLVQSGLRFRRGRRRFFSGRSRASGFDWRLDSDRLVRYRGQYRRRIPVWEARPDRGSDDGETDNAGRRRQRTQPG